MKAESLVNVFIVCLIVGSVKGDNRCEFNQTCSASFQYSDIQLIGCPTDVSNGFSRSMASLNCLNNFQCKAIICNSETCSTCFGDQMLSLSFNMSDSTYLKTKLTVLSMGYDPVTLGMGTVLVLPDVLTPGDLVYIRATVLKFDSVLLDFLKDDNNSNLFFRTRCVDVCSDTFTCTDAQCVDGKYMKITDKVNGTWSLSPKTDVYPFKINQQFELHFLVLSKSILIYIDRKYYMTYNTPFPAQSVYGIRVRGTINVHEFIV